MVRRRSDSPPLIELPSAPDFALERAAMRRGFWPVAGVDEVGRGPLAGPVVAAAVVLDPKRIPKGLNDSKRLTAADREALFVEIAKRALAIAVASVSASAIDETDIRKASLEAMRRACAGLTIQPAHVIVDGRDKVPGLACECVAVVKGDQRSQSVAAASIIAKVTRDRMMRRCAERHPHYGFDLHVGYATRTHREAIAVNGAVARLHRLSFSPFRLDGEQAEEIELDL